MVVGVVAGAAVLAVLVLIGVFKMMWRVAEPNEALIISGSNHRTEGLEAGMGFRISRGAARWYCRACRRCASCHWT